MCFFESSFLTIITSYAVHVHSKLTCIPFVFCKPFQGNITSDNKKFKINDWHIFVHGLGVIIDVVAQLSPSIKPNILSNMKFSGLQ